ncbi:MAG: hypothetical protein ACK4L8_13085 [Nitrincola lacisaponensis]|uniref:hypothetical protein n=1 Tax=Nitrincola lacisaponensis TaxID=267850 RepID=UPI00391BC398
MRRIDLPLPLQQGVGLTEVMITLLLLSTASLALTQLQLRNLQTAHQSHTLTRESLVQGEAIERLWQQRCYLAWLDAGSRSEYLLGRYPTLFSPDPEHPLSPRQLWDQHAPVTLDC